MSNPWRNQWRSKFWPVSVVALILWLFWLGAAIDHKDTEQPVAWRPVETEYEMQSRLARQHCKEPSEQLFSWKWSTDGKVVTCLPWQGKPYTVKIK